MEWIVVRHVGVCGNLLISVATEMDSATVNLAIPAPSVQRVSLLGMGVVGH